MIIEKVKLRVVCNDSEKILHPPLQYLCELALLNGELCLKYQPSVVAASSLCLSRHTLQLEAWVS